MVLIRPRNFEVQLDWNSDPLYDWSLDPPEYEPTLAETVILANQVCLSGATILGKRDIVRGITLPAYSLAGWFAWNWWRLLWEPEFSYREPTPEWIETHYLNSIPDGWLWPRIKVVSDGLFITLTTTPSPQLSVGKVRYQISGREEISVDDFRSGVKDFIEKVLARLDESSLEDTPLHSLWKDIQDEEADPQLSLFRKVEAFHGSEPDVLAPEKVESYIRYGKEFGEGSMLEVISESPQALSTMKDSLDFDSSPADRVSLSLEKVSLSSVPWRVGREAARELREQERLGIDPISDVKLAGLFGVSREALNSSSQQRPLSFELDREEGSSLVLKSFRVTARRFALSRLFGDWILDQGAYSLRPATDSATYRQKRQRAFAAEFLCPLESLEEFLGGDFSEEKRTDAADHFEVSPWTVDTTLVNHERLDRDLVDPELMEGQRTTT